LAARSSASSRGRSTPVERPREQVRADLVARLGLDVDPDLLDQALVHRSWAYENGGVPTNERLEFLGDSVLGLVVTDALYTRHPDLSEGKLAKLRAAVVNMRALALVARGLDLGACVRLGRGEEATGGREKDSILADTTEAVIGAAYLTAGIDGARDLVLRLVGPLLAASVDLGAGLDWKTSLQELGAAQGLGTVEYLVTETGPDHAKSFSAVATFPEAPDPGGEPLAGRGSGRSKKEAEQAAAADAWRALDASTSRA
jgi:ribonuclease-3